jgi:nucleolar GTP-binding protein
MSQSSSSFKNIEPVPSGTDFLDIVLSRTQRRLPTVIRPGFKISRIRAFYARKVKYTQESFTEKLEAILTQFPRLDAIHPFHADLVLIPLSNLQLTFSSISCMIKSITKLL